MSSDKRRCVLKSALANADDSQAATSSRSHHMWLPCYSGGSRWATTSLFLLTNGVQNPDSRSESLTPTCRNSCLRSKAHASNEAAKLFYFQIRFYISNFSLLASALWIVSQETRMNPMKFLSFFYWSAGYFRPYFRP